MTKRILVFVLLNLLALSAVPARAAQPDAGVFALSSYIPADADLVGALRIDDATITALDALLAKFTAFAADVGAPLAEPATMRGLLQPGGLFGDENTNLLDWAGDSVFAAANQGVDFAPGMSLVVIPLDDRAAAESIIAPSGVKGETQGSYTVYDFGTAIVAFSDEVLLTINNATEDEVAVLLSGDYPRLSDDAAFAAAVATLPEDDYTLGVYASGEGMNQFQMGAVPYTSIVVGATMLDGDTLALDVAMSTAIAGTPSAAVDAAFTRFIPADSSTFVQSVGLGGLLESSIQGVGVLAGSNQDSRAAIESQLSMFGIDLDETLAWMDGDFAVFGRFDFGALFTGMLAQPPNSAMLSEAFDFGLVIETSNPDATGRFVETLSSQIRMLASGSTVTDEAIGGVPATVVTVAVPDGDGSFELKFALAATDEVFVIGTYGGVADSLSQSPGVAGSALANDAARYWLSDAGSVWFIDGATIGQAGFFTAAVILGPSIANVFSEITDQLGNTIVTVSPPTAVPSGFQALGMPFESPEQALAALERFERFIRHATVSTRTTADGALVRITLTLGE